jgi:hypothetical protein
MLSQRRSKVEALVVSKSISAANPFHVDCCSICASPMHLAQTCPSLSAFVESLMKQVNAFNDFRKQSNGPFSETYNPGWRNHPNFSWKQNQLMTQGGSSPNSIPPWISSTGSPSKSSYPASTIISSPYSSPCLFSTVHFGRHPQGLHTAYRAIHQ